MTDRLKFTAASLAELHALPDGALLKTREAAAFLNLSPASLSWYRAQRIGPDHVRAGANSVRYSANPGRPASLRPVHGRRGAGLGQGGEALAQGITHHGMHAPPRTAFGADKHQRVQAQPRQAIRSVGGRP